MKDKWSSFFFQATVLNETDYFIVLEYSMKTPAFTSSHEEARTKHSKFIGFIESRIKNFLQALQVQIGLLGPEDGLIS